MMGQDSKIEWCDHTFNPWYGCTKVSAGCANCYAETMMSKRFKKVVWGKGQARILTDVANWKLPLRWGFKCSHNVKSSRNILMFVRPTV